MAQAYTLARYYAQRDLKAHIRKHQGYTAAQRVELGTLAREWFDDQPELISQAQEAIQKWCLQQAAKRTWPADRGFKLQRACVRQRPTFEARRVFRFNTIKAVRFPL
jgi:hypothetical protein